MSVELFRFLWNVHVLRIRILKKSIMPGGNEGPNWILFAGGAAVTALSYIIGRRQKHDDRVEEREGKSGKAQLANHKDGFDSGYTSKACSRQNSFGSVDSSSLDNSTHLGLPTGLALVNGTRTGGLDDGFHLNNHHDRPQSPPSAEFSEEERSFQSSIPSAEEDVRRNNPHGVQLARTAKKDMVHRLRKQLKSRDEMILSMQVQISEYERNLSLSDAHVSELQSRLEESERSLSLSDAHISELQARLEASERSLSLSDAHVSGLEARLEESKRSLSLFDDHISELQARLEASGRSLSLSDAHASELQARLEASERNLSLSNTDVCELRARLEAYGGVLSDVDKEVQLLLNQLADLKFDAKMGDCNQSAAGDTEFVTSCEDECRDMHATLLEVKKLRELLDRLEDETTAREIGWEALSREHQSMLDKVDYLECALKEQRAIVSEKQQALDMKQVELFGVTCKLQDIQYLLQAQIEETESLRRSKAELEVCIDRLTKKQDIDEPEADTVKADNLIESRDVDKLESNVPKSNGLINTEHIEELESNVLKSNGLIEARDVDDSEAEIPRADRLFESQDIDYDLVKIFDSVSESGSESRDSIDSEFDEMLDGTLDDLLKICSTSVTPASTPKSSVLSPNSGSKKFQYF
ncbi:hypothetical protein M758_7G149200 [Ceratodon purpureus]|nr:hypothetical protein M758_7G149200 [Ceratodon purpureus]